jgi:DMSO/TMAO reductase YedYZ molybdopterin-dependent catalytic subunit
MGFFGRNRRSLVEKGFSPDRLPPGQYYTERYPVLHTGDVPVIDPATWRLRVFGLVEREREISFDELRELPVVDAVVDIHCVTKWSKFDMRWTGVRVRDVLASCGLDARATHVVQHAAYGYTTNAPLADVLGEDVSGGRPGAVPSRCSRSREARLSS